MYVCRANKVYLLMYTWTTPTCISEDKLYSKLKHTPANTVEYTVLKTNVSTYNGILQRNIRIAKQLHHKSSFENYKHDINLTRRKIR